MRTNHVVASCHPAIKLGFFSNPIGPTISVGPIVSLGEGTLQ
jgi:hypothetical protein